jgi:hypothetical protein
MSVVTGGLVYPVLPSGSVESNAPPGTSQSIDWSRGNVQILDLTTASGDVAVAFSDPSDGATYQLIVVRDSSGTNVASWPEKVRWPNLTAPILQSSNNGNVYDLIEFVYDGAHDLYHGRDLSGAEQFVADDAIGSSQIQNSAVIATKIASAAVGTAQLQTDAVTNAILRNSAGVSVIGRSTNSTGDPGDIAAASDRTYLGRSSGALAFKSLDVGDLPTLTASGQVDFGTGSDYAEVTIAASWVIAGQYAFSVNVRGGSAEHPIADEDAAVEELKAVVVSDDNAQVKVGVFAPNLTTGRYVVTVVAIGGLT